MVAIVHNLVGLLHAPMGVYYAYLDRAPVFIIGATGPLEEPKRRPYIDWIHSAHVQGQAIRDYIKWDYQPNSPEAIPDSFARAYSVMMAARQGPVYLCYDAGLQEAPLVHEIKLPPPESAIVPTPMAPDPAALVKAANTLACLSDLRGMFHTDKPQHHMLAVPASTAPQDRLVSDHLSTARTRRATATRIATTRTTRVSSEWGRLLNRLHTQAT